MPQPRLSKAAVADIEDLYVYGALRFGADHAGDYLAKLMKVIALLGDRPLLGRERPEIRPPIRIVTYEAHNILYDVIDGGAVVQRVLHHNVDWQHGL